MKYSHELNSKVETQIPDSILNAMTVEGWNAFGIYELVKRLRAKEQRNLTNHSSRPVDVAGETDHYGRAA